MNLVAVGNALPPGLATCGAEAPEPVWRTVDSRALGRALQRFRGDKRVALPGADEAPATDLAPTAR